MIFISFIAWITFVWINAAFFSSVLSIVPIFDEESKKKCKLFSFLHKKEKQKKTTNFLVRYRASHSSNWIQLNVVENLLSSICMFIHCMICCVDLSSKNHFEKSSASRRLQQLRNYRSQTLTNTWARIACIHTALMKFLRAFENERQQKRRRNGKFSVDGMKWKWLSSVTSSLLFALLSCRLLLSARQISKCTKWNNVMKIWVEKMCAFQHLEISCNFHIDIQTNDNAEEISTIVFSHPPIDGCWKTSTDKRRLEGVVCIHFSPHAFAGFFRRVKTRRLMHRFYQQQQKFQRRSRNKRNTNLFQNAFLN